jgi:LmbE family N-acetylglucosaminyl deacetylase
MMTRTRKKSLGDRGSEGHGRFVCRHEAASFPLFLASDRFEWPSGVAGHGRTAFLNLDLDLGPAGRFREPFIEARLGDARQRQYFERGARGLRPVNLSPLLHENSGGAVAEIGLYGKSLRWGREGHLILFNPPPVLALGGSGSPTTNATMLVLAPHPDDAELAAFGLYSDRPSSSWVVTITAGELGSMDLSKVVAADEERRSTCWKASLRVWDSVTIPQLGGVPSEHCLNLAYPDGALEGMSREANRAFRLACEPDLSRPRLRARNRDRDFQEASRECTWTGLVTELRLLLDKARPAIVVCPHPILDDHSDHAFSTIALEQALRQSKHEVSAFFLYVVHARGARGYPYGPANSVVSLPPATDGQWLADSIYSHPLRAELRGGKYFAVEAAHDVRAYGDGAPKTFRQLVGTLRREVSAFVGGTAVDPKSFFLRRAPRPNELYYVVSADSLSELVRRRCNRR